MNEPKQRITTWSVAELERRLEEIRFLGTQFAMNGCEAPAELGGEFAELERELRRRAPERGLFGTRPSK